MKSKGSTYREIQAPLVSHNLGTFTEGVESLDEELENVESVCLLGFLILLSEDRSQVLPFLNHVLGESCGAYSS